MSSLDFEELACVVCGLDYEKVVDEGDEWDTIDKAMYDKFGIDFDTFENVASALIDYTPIVKSGLTGKLYHGFATEKNGIGLFIVKKETKFS